MSQNPCGATHFVPETVTMRGAQKTHETPASAETDRGRDRTGLEFDMANATPLTGSAAAHLDACDRCLINTEVPYGGFTLPNGSLTALYVCADCGYRWHTSWNDEVCA